MFGAEKQIITAKLIIEILGRPPEYVVQSLNQIIDQINALDGVELKDKKISEPKPIEGKNLFTVFTEIEIDIKGISDLFFIVLKYMPSHVEIIKPKEFKINNFDLGEIMDVLISKMHRYDEIAKRITLERDILNGKINAIMQKYNISLEEIKNLQPIKPQPVEEKPKKKARKTSKKKTTKKKSKKK